MKISFTLWKCSMCLLTLIVLLLVLVSGCETKATEHTGAVSIEKMVAEGKRIDSLFMDAYNRADVDALMALHWNSPEFKAYPPGEMEINGYEAAKALYTKEFANSKGAKLEYLSVFNIPYGDMIAGHGTYRWSMPMEGGPPMVIEGRYSDVKAYKDGKMVIVFDHSSIPSGPPEEEETPVDSTEVQ